MDYREPEWVAEKLGIDKNTVYRFLQEGTLPAVQLGRKWLVSEARLERWLAEETERQTLARRQTQKPSGLARALDNPTAGLRQAMKRAHGEARRMGHEQVDNAHLLLGLAMDRSSGTAGAMRRLGISADVVCSAIEGKLKAGQTPAPRRLKRTVEAKRSLRLAARLAMRESAGKPLAPVGTDHLLSGVLLSRRGLGYEILVKHDVTRQRLREALRDAESELAKGEPHGTR